MVLKPTLEKKGSEILPEIEIDLLARALSVDVFESICSKSDIGLCADKARSLGDLSNEADDGKLQKREQLQQLQLQL